EHHRLTPAIIPKVEPPEGNCYPILRGVQTKHATFPPYAYLAFQVIFLPVWLLAQWMFPSWPFLIGGMIAVTFSYGGYENLHAAQHLSFGRYWERWFGYRLIGWWLKVIYRVHLGHHANNLVNETVFGFCSFAVWDWLARTLALVPLPNPGVRLKVAAPKPRWPINVLDDLTRPRPALQGRERH
ncbi:MAG: hypothetical protein AAB499_02315, partial [Patescibacteria group bacterium]